MRNTLLLLLLSASVAGAQGGHRRFDHRASPGRQRTAGARCRRLRASLDGSHAYRLHRPLYPFRSVGGLLSRCTSGTIGFSATEITTDLGKNGHVDLVELKRRPLLLDSVVVQVEGKCPIRQYSGFNCRKLTGKGIYLTDDDIMDRGAIELGDIFRDMDGFRIEQVMTQFGMRPNPIPTRGNHCLNADPGGRRRFIPHLLPTRNTKVTWTSPLR